MKDSIKEFDAEYSGYYEDNVQRQKRLKILIEKYGTAIIAEAAGMTESTLIQYARVKSVPAINENSVLKAERWVEFYENK